MQTLSTHAHERPAMDWALLFVRLIVATIFIAHGSQKLFGAFGGPGMSGAVGMMGMVAWPVAIAEFFGGIGLLVGFLTRFSALSLIGVMVGAIYMVHWKNGFFAGNGGFEFNLALIGLLGALLIAGPGNLALSRALPLPKDPETGRAVPALE